MVALNSKHSLLSYYGIIFTTTQSRKQAICGELVDTLVLTTVSLWKLTLYFYFFFIFWKTSIKWKDFTLLSASQVRQKFKCQVLLQHYFTSDINIYKTLHEINKNVYFKHFITDNQLKNTVTQIQLCLVQ